MRRTVLICVFMLLVAMAAAAQDGGPFGYIAEFQVKPGMESEFVELVKKYDKPMFDGLVEEGAVLAWGLDARIVHEEGEATHMFWWVTPDLGSFDKVFAAFNAMDMSDEDEEKIRDSVQLGKHHDHLTRTTQMKISEGEPSSPPYTYWSFVKVKPGKSDEWRELFDKYTKPILDKLVADGDLYGYGVDVEWVHTGSPGWRAIWVVSTTMGGFDKLRAAFVASWQERPEEANEAIGYMFRKTTEGDEHRDSLWRAIPMESMESME